VGLAPETLFESTISLMVILNFCTNFTMQMENTASYFSWWGGSKTYQSPRFVSTRTQTSQSNRTVFALIVFDQSRVCTASPHSSPTTTFRKSLGGGAKNKWRRQENPLGSWRILKINLESENTISNNYIRNFNLFSIFVLRCCIWTSTCTLHVLNSNWWTHPNGDILSFPCGYNKKHIHCVRD